MALTPPTGARMILFDDAPRHMRGVTPRPFTPSFPAKDPTEDLTYGMGFARVIEGSQTIVSATIVALPAGSMDILQTQVIGTVVVFRAIGGADGIPAEIVVTATLSDGQTIRRTAILPVRRVADLPCPPCPPTPEPCRAWSADFSRPANSGAYVYL